MRGGGRVTPARLRPLGFLLLAVGLVAVGQAIRTRAGIELDPESLQAWVRARGWLGPVLFVLMVAFRQFLLVPSALTSIAKAGRLGVSGSTASTIQTC